MNRQLKFRIWDKQNKKWLENSSSLHCNSNWTICPFTGNVVDYVETCDENGENFSASPANDYYWEDGKLIKEPRYITQQYTGLKDKNGILIFEGDLVQYNQNSNYDGMNFEVVWSDASFGWVLKSKTGDYLTNQITPNGPRYNFLDVIGNVFENPELLHIVNNE
jgi:uncharacterized phage protein (TIGR01671 family)